MRKAPDETERNYPLDLRAGGYSYIERPNPRLIQLASAALRSAESPRVLDVGCGAGANARALQSAFPGAAIHGIEPNARAAELARHTAQSVFEGSIEAWLADVGAAETERYDAVLLSDVLEHLPDPFSTLSALADAKCLRQADWLVSVPNYAVWYNRVNTLFGRFAYSWSGLYDRTHLRFFTRRSFSELLRQAGFSILRVASTPSLAQSLAPVLRRGFKGALDQGEHLALTELPSFQAYQRYVEPLEGRLCELWPELLGFQIVVHARLS